MKRIFSSTTIVVGLIVLSILGGGSIGYWLNTLPINVRSGLTYGFVAFSVLPITLCLFGVKEAGAAFPGIAKYLNHRQRREFRRAVDRAISRIIFMAFGLVLLQVLAAFVLLYLSEGYEYIILGVLFGGVISSLVYGLYVCFLVRELSDFTEEVLSAKADRDRHEEYCKRIEPEKQ